MTSTVRYDVKVVDLTSEMLDEIMQWMADTWGGLELVEIEAHEERVHD